MSLPAHRYAIYLAPSEPFRTFGSRWLGRDADTGAALPAPEGMAPPPSDWVNAAAHYALHATLKPPFRLAPATNGSMLDAAVRDFVRGLKPFDAPLALRALRGFVAWCLADGSLPPMQALADACVLAFERFRAPPAADELAR